MKAISDQFGHEAGDRALKETALVIATVLRGSDVIARLGGDEFCAILAGAEPKSAASVVARIEAALAKRHAASDEPFDLSLSAAVAKARPGEVATLADLTQPPPTPPCMKRSTRRRRAGTPPTPHHVSRHGPRPPGAGAGRFLSLGAARRSRSKRCALPGRPRP
jgi:Diguanylate cyclase, GGDEF domain